MDLCNFEGRFLVLIDFGLPLYYHFTNDGSASKHDIYTPEPIFHLPSSTPCYAFQSL